MSKDQKAPQSKQAQATSTGKAKKIVRRKKKVVSKKKPLKPTSTEEKTKKKETEAPKARAVSADFNKVLTTLLRQAVLDRAKAGEDPIPSLDPDHPDYNAKNPEVILFFGSIISKRSRLGAANSIRKFDQQMKDVLNWFNLNGRNTKPMHPEDIVQYLSYRMLNFHDKYSTLTSRLSVIKKWHTLENETVDIKDPGIINILNGYKRTISVKQKQAPVIPLEVFQAKIRSLGDTPIDRRDKCLLLTGLLGAFRRSELVALNVEDITFFPDKAIIQLKKSKSNQEGRFEEKVLLARTPKYLFTQIAKKSQPAPLAPPVDRQTILPLQRLTKPLEGLPCPVKTLREHIEYFFLQPKDPLFTSLLWYRHDPAILPERLNDWMVGFIVKKVFGNTYSAHSLRASFVTISRMAGATDTEIQSQTGHRDGKMLDRYTRVVNKIKHNAVRTFQIE